ncbi:MAG TPA: NADH-quinone oxidoreductase subunit M, partial [Anaerolineae bacterium]
AVLGIVFTAAMFLWKVIQNVLLGPFNEKWAGLADMKAFEVITLAPLVFLMVLIGVYPSVILNTINTVSVAILQALKI